MPQFITSNQIQQNGNNAQVGSEPLMKIVIEKSFPLYCVSEQDISFLKSCSIWFKTDKEAPTEFENINPDEPQILILEQKITIPYPKVEEFLEIINYYSHYLISLNRYEFGRYVLKLEG